MCHIDSAIVSSFVLAKTRSLLAAGFAAAQDTQSSFNLSTSKTFAPGEQPQVHLYTHKVDALEFRVYRVKDPGWSFEPVFDDRALEKLAMFV